MFHGVESSLIVQNPGVESFVSQFRPSLLQKHQVFSGHTTQLVKSLPAMDETDCNAGDPGLIPELGRSPGEGNGNPIQYFCLQNLMDRGAW